LPCILHPWTCFLGPNHPFLPLSFPFCIHVHGFGGVGHPFLFELKEKKGPISQLELIFWFLTIWEEKKSFI
jgi:hypothetical protein